MKIPIIFSILFLISHTLGFSQNLVTADSKIKDVTVFLNGAQVTRTAAVSLTAGENIVTLNGLAQGINPQSITVDGNSAYLIKSVNHETNFLENTEKSAEIKELENKIADLDFKLSTRSSLEKVYNEEKSLLLSNKSMKGANEALLVEDLKEMAAYFREHLEELEYKLLELRLEKKELEEKKRQFQMELSKSRNGLTSYTSQIDIAVGADKNVSSTITFSYIVYNASWYATYDVRTTDVSEPVELIYTSNVSQYTGIDWEDVNITLSTGNPMVNGNKPELSPWYISVYNAEESYRLYQSNQKRDLKKQEESYDAEPRIASEGQLGYGRFENSTLGGTSILTESIESLITAEFKISIPFDIPSDGESYDIEIQRNVLPSNYSYYAAPSLDKDAYLLARLTDYSALSLLPGDANVFYQGSFVGTSFLDPNSTEDTLDVSLGKDKSIIISREKEEEFCKTSSFGGNKKTSRSYKITIKNTKSTTISLKLEDQIPISNQNNIQVNTEELSGGILNEKTGIITWNLDLQPGESKVVYLKFDVKYPKKLKLARL